MECAAADEGDEHDDVGVLEGVDALEVGGLVDGDVAVHRHADDDVHRRRHERVEHGDLEVRLEK